MTIRIPIKSVIDIETRLAAIREMARDYEHAHGLEDQLRHDVLVSIANGATHARQLAAAALESRDIAFERHRA